MIRWLALAMLAWPAVAIAEGNLVNASTCEMSWTAPTQTTTGRPLTNLKEYWVYVSDTGRSLPPKPTLIVPSSTPAPKPNTRVVVPCPQPILGQKYMTVHSLNIDNQPSVASAPVPFVAIKTSVTPTPSTAVPDQLVKVDVVGTGHPRDWVGMVKPGQPATAFDPSWKYLNNSQTPPKKGVTTATVTLEAPPAGPWRVFLAGRDSFTIQAEAPLAVVTPKYCPCRYVYHSTTGALDVIYADGSTETVTPPVVP